MVCRSLFTVGVAALLAAVCMSFSPSARADELDFGELPDFRLDDDTPEAAPKELTDTPATAPIERDDAEAKKRAKIVKDYFRKLGRMRPGDSKKKSLDDYFLVGTAELTAETRHADIRFEVKQGQTDVAEFLVSYTHDLPETVLRKWHVFSRFADGDKAEEALQLTRTQYDEMAAYQAQLRQIYGARTSRRC